MLDALDDEDAASPEDEPPPPDEPLPLDELVDDDVESELDDELPLPDELEPPEPEPPEPEPPEPLRLSVLKKPLPLNVTPTGWNTFLTGIISPESGWAISVSESSVNDCWTSIVSSVSTNLYT